MNLPCHRYKYNLSIPRSLLLLTNSPVQGQVNGYGLRHYSGALSLVLPHDFRGRSEQFQHQIVSAAALLFSGEADRQHSSVG